MKTSSRKKISKSSSSDAKKPPKKLPPFAPDPDKKVYSLYATKFIPRTYVIDRTGKIAHQTVGYNAAEFEKLVAAVRDALKQPNFDKVTTVR